MLTRRRRAHDPQQEQGDAEQEHRTATDDVGEAAVERGRHGLGQQVRREQPGELGEAAQLLHDRGDGGRDHRAVDRDQGDAQHEGTQDRPALRAQPDAAPSRRGGHAEVSPMAPDLALRAAAVPELSFRASRTDLRRSDERSRAVLVHVTDSPKALACHSRSLISWRRTARPGRTTTPVGWRSSPSSTVRRGSRATTAAERLGDPGAVSSPASYAAWLRRIAAAWSAVPMPTTSQAAAVWPFAAIQPLSLGRRRPGGRRPARARARRRRPPHRRHHPHPGLGPRVGMIASLANQAVMEDVDAAYVCGAAYVAVVTAPRSPSSPPTSSTSRPPRPAPRCPSTTCGTARRSRAFARSCAANWGDWADAAGTGVAERVVLAARMLSEHLSTALTQSPHPGW